MVYLVILSYFASSSGKILVDSWCCILFFFKLNHFRINQNICLNLEKILDYIHQNIEALHLNFGETKNGI